MVKPTILTPIINDKIGLASFMIPKLRDNFEIVPRDVFDRDPTKYNQQVVAVLTYQDFGYFGIPEVNNGLFDQLENLKVVSACSAGFDHLDLKYLRNRGIRIGHTPTGVSEATADQAMALMLAAARNIVPGVHQMMGNNQVVR